MATYYVNQKVPVSGDGLSLSTAFKTIGEARALATSNDTIKIYSGTYFEKLSVSNITNVKHVGVGKVVVDERLYYDKHYDGVSISNITLITTSIFSTPTFLDCVIVGMAANSNYGIISAENCVFIDCAVDGRSNTTSFKNNTMHNCVVSKINSQPHIFINNVFSDSSVYLGSDDYFHIGFFICEVKFAASESYVAVDSAVELIAKRDSDLDTTTQSDWFETCSFIDDAIYSLEDIFNNPTNNDYTLKPFLDFPANTVINPFSVGSLNLTKIGAKDIALAWNTETEFTADANGSVVGGFHKTAGTSSIATGIAKDWGVAREMNTLPAFGTMFDRDGVTLTAESPSNFTTREITTEWAFSATASSTTLDAGAGTTYPYLKFKTTGKVYYVDNGGSLVGNGDSTYDALVTGGLTPQVLIARSLKPRLQIIEE